MTWYFTGCCYAGPGTGGSGTPGGPTQLANYSYDTGVVYDVTDGSGPSVVISGPQSIATSPTATNVSFGGSIDDLAVMIPVGGTVTANTNLTTHVTSVTVPAGSVILASNTGFFTYGMVVTDGTHTATITAGSTNAATTMATAGLRVVAFPGNVSITTLHTLGMADTSGNLSFKWALVPSGFGYISISGGTYS